MDERLNKSKDIYKKFVDKTGLFIWEIKINNVFVFEHRNAKNGIISFCGYPVFTMSTREEKNLLDGEEIVHVGMDKHPQLGEVGYTIPAEVFNEFVIGMYS